MASITRLGVEIETCGALPDIGTQAPGFTLVDIDLNDCSLSDYKGKRVILNIFPSLDTAT